ncbi:hypothetical protein [Marinococcus halotolerans]|uniref:hypothetical protein n=1 Tax=Marinococcus halotolerans TaxID=301092 RepID=UPI0003B5B0CB|nr:hypothetical protein [Marinococcus halotolerans]
MPESLLTTYEVVQLYGTPKCKAYYEKHKKLGGHKEKLHHTLNEIYEDWEIIKVKNKRMYKLIIEREVPLKRIDKRSFNGKKQIPYEEITKNLILNYVLSDKMKYTTITTPLLAYELGLMSSILFYASKKHTNLSKQEYYEQLEDQYKVGYTMFWHIVSKESKRLKNHLVSILKRMNGNEITHMSVTNGVKLEKGKEVHDIIDPFKAATLNNKLKQLKNAHFVSSFEIISKPNMPKVKDYKEQENRLLKSKGYEYIYPTNLITLLKPKNEIEKFDSQLLLKDFFIVYLDNSYKLAQNIQNSFFTDPYKKKDNSEKLLEILGGRPKPAHAIFVGTEYEYILENSMERLIFDDIIQAKFSNIYPSEYLAALKIIQEVQDTDEEEE